MAIAEREIQKSKILTYEEYLHEGETPGRYEIVDGVREYMTNPASEHQIIQGNLYRMLQDYEEAMFSGISLLAPVDIVVDRKLLLVRQPDLLFISFDRWGDKAFDDPAPLTNAPELVIEILSPSESRRQMDRKVREYANTGVLECWLVSPQASTIEVLKLSTSEAAVRLGVYAPGETFQSNALPGLEVDVAKAFRLPKQAKLN